MQGQDQCDIAKGLISLYFTSRATRLLYLFVNKTDFAGCLEALHSLEHQCIANIFTGGKLKRSENK